MKKYLTIIFLITYCLTACKPGKINTESKYYQWLENEKNGLVKVKYINGFKIKVKYFPPEFSAYNELKYSENLTSYLIDSVTNIYKASRSFLVTISPDDREGNSFDIMFADVVNSKKLKERVYQMNFSIDDYFYLETSTKEKYFPVLHVFENTYGLGKHRNINIAFTAKEGDALFNDQTIDLVFNDEIFLTGISHFRFQKNDIDNIPGINFWKKTD